MAVTARIDDLRHKFEENPRRYFAPLANEYRKAGDLDTAIAIGREQLAAYPTHISGHIVLGQALFEAGRRDEARPVFEKAAALDPENVIALRHLGDIARDAGDEASARRWYKRVLDADPRNDDIAAQLAALAEARNQPRSAAAPSPLVDGPPATDSSVDGPGNERFSDSAPTEEFDIAFVDGWELPTVADRDVPPRDPRLAPNELAAVFDIVEPSAVQPSADAPTEVEPSAEGGGDNGAWPDGSPLPETLDESFDPVVGLDVAPPRNEDAGREQLEERATAPSAADDDAHVGPDELHALASGAFGTPTLAALLEQQGHHEQAASIYARLAGEGPADERPPGDAVESQVAAGAGAGDHGEDGARELPNDHAAPLAALDTPAERPEQTAREFFAALASRTPVGPAAAAAESARLPLDDAWLWERDASDADERAAATLAAAFAPASLGALSILDELAAAGEEPSPGAPPRDGPPVALGSAAASEDLSFDRFFAGFAEYESPPVGEPTAPPESLATDVPPPPPATAGRPEGSADLRTDAVGLDVDQADTPSDDDDLTAFNAWLRGLTPS